MLYKDLSLQLIGSAITVYHTLGPGLAEKIYQEALAIDLEDNGFSVSKEIPFKVFYKDKLVGAYFADLILEGKIIIEVKARNKWSKDWEAQLLNYQNISGLSLGFLFNFGFPRLRYKRFLIG